MITEARIDARITAMLVDRANQSVPGSFFIIPPNERDGDLFYAEDDVYAISIARTAGIDAQFLIPAVERRFLAEYSAGWILNLAIAVGQDLSAEAIISVGRYVLARASEALRLGLHEGPAEAIETKLTIAELKRSPDGSLTIKGLHYSGPSGNVAVEITRAISIPENNGNQ